MIKKKVLLLTLILSSSLLSFGLPKGLADTWLNGWNYRSILTLDHDDIDDDLTGFQALIYLSASSGINNGDVSFIFDELGTNKLKIAFTESDGVTELYAEIEFWDSISETAFIWVKINSVSKDENTILYLYFDNEKADNTDYIGDDPDDTATLNVWSNNFVLVDHQKDDPDISNTKDSTSYNNDGSKKGADEPIETETIIKFGQLFDGSDDEIDFGGDAEFDNLNGVGTVSFWVKVTETDQSDVKVLSKHYKHFEFGVHDDSGHGGSFALTANWRNSLDQEWYAFGNYDKSIDTWYHVVNVKNGTGLHIYVNGVLYKEDLALAGGKIQDTTINLFAGSRNGASNFFKGAIDEIRVSNIDRSIEYAKATYESERDNLIVYGGAVETASVLGGLSIIALVIALTAFVLVMLHTVKR